MGTQEYTAMVRDLELYKTAASWQGCNNCNVHAGFLSEWRSLKSCIVGSLENAGCPSGSNIRVTGHSMGGAITALAMTSLADQGWRIEEGWSFGMPRMGDQLFIEMFNKRFSNVFYRVTHHMDPVVHVPPATFVTDWHFQHAEPEYFYDGKVGAGYAVCSKDGDVACSGQYSNVVHDLFHIGDHTEYMDIQIGTPGCNQGWSSGLQDPGQNASSGAGRGEVLAV